MNANFGQPLHGVACEPFCPFDAQRHRHRAMVVERAIRKQGDASPLWELVDEGQRYASRIRLFRQQEGLVLDVNCEGKGSFLIDAEGIGIDWNREGTAAAHYFQTWALACWLELRSVLCLHANALAVPGSDHAIALMAPSRSGKTTLSMALVEKGFELMSDDMVALYPAQQAAGNYEVFPGWPECRMWPDSIERCGWIENRWRDEETVHARFAKRRFGLRGNTGSGVKRQLKAIYLLDRTEDETMDPRTPACERFAGTAGKPEPAIAVLPKSVALIQLLQNTVLGSAFKALGMEQQRFTVMARLVSAVPVKRVSYRSGFEHLLDVAEAFRREAMTPGP